MTTTLRTVGEYVAGLVLTGFAVLLLGFGLVHLVVAVPQAVFPVVAGLLTLGTGFVTFPVVRRALRRRTGYSLAAADVRRWTLLAVGATVALLALYVAVSFV